MHIKVLLPLEFVAEKYNVFAEEPISTSVVLILPSTSKFRGAYVELISGKVSKLHNVF